MGRVVKEFIGHAQDATDCLFLTSAVKPMYGQLKGATHAPR
jgi:hypothetical protein